MKYLTIDTTTKATALALAEISGADSLTDGPMPWQRVHVVGEVFLHDQKTHSERLIPFLDALVTAAAWTLDEVDFIGVVRGPGSFTGIRIGLATAQGLAKVLNRPVLGVLSLDCLSWAAAAAAPSGVVSSAELPLGPELLIAGSSPAAPCAGTSSAPMLSAASSSGAVSSGRIPLVTAVILDARKNEWYAACYRWETSGSRSVLISPCAVAPQDFLRRLNEQEGTVVFAGDALLHREARQLIADGLGNRAVILPPEHALPRGSYAARECAYAQYLGTASGSAPYYIRLSEAETKRRAAGSAQSEPSRSD